MTQRTDIKSKAVPNASNGEDIRLGEGLTVDQNVILGYLPPSCKNCPSVLVIGPNAHIRAGTVIYFGTSIGRNLDTGHNVVIRERNIIGDNFCIWSNSTIDYGCAIGNNVKVHHNVYVAQFTTIEDDVFLAPSVSLANDIHPGCPNARECLNGPFIRKGAQIGINACILPGVDIGEYAVVGAGSVVTRDVPPRAVACGNPARVVGMIDDVVCRTGLRKYAYRHLRVR